jgi:endo-1,4-beta-D-glucanase Y
MTIIRNESEWRATLAALNTTERRPRKFPFAVDYVEVQSRPAKSKVFFSFFTLTDAKRLIAAVDRGLR